MIAFPNAKINIGLQVLNRRADGYHDLQTVFYPIKLHDVLELVEAGETRFIPSGLTILGDGEDNLCMRAYGLLQHAYDLPPAHIYLHKVIPIGAGLGGGSADAAFLLKLANEHFGLGLDEVQLMGYARQLGADCAFFIRNMPTLASGIGDILEDVAIDLSSYHIVLVKPNIHISTATAYGMVTPRPADRPLATAIEMPVTTWRDNIVNDFEAGIFSEYPEISAVKAFLYDKGAVFAAMSGSGSSVYGLFEEPVTLSGLDPTCTVFYMD
ncbi:4-(cytidine 5'-diphospho)-2-C-methyl-D-erythritol kinase [Parapedobacter sp. 10938]|uniref:4-(cytidine 5'-diphospho)-2-C-methyl-D-erythritol kinase n=1 Tax=Parapedobacter flavus TaxID=3110225 RepID=UPI002DB7A75E|nr:4-(cytidine 5'-diphospho)-2-C-methyl-D-erythritol kinase [Parapedobacter sp. 10938]MEC3878850.1 4-(cytidine 5'-diphospho)-2-C-methyl-D-erythritol kinase [Parapedobacter sp. 10938]